MNPDCLCVCGHTRKRHFKEMDFAFCEACANDCEGLERYSHEFKMDNLKYLENKSESKDAN